MKSRTDYSLTSIEDASPTHESARIIDEYYQAATNLGSARKGHLVLTPTTRYLVAHGQEV